MTQVKTRKKRVMFSVEQKLDYVKLMVNEGYTNKQIIEISGAGPTAVARWKKQYLAELNGARSLPLGCKLQQLAKQ